MPVLASNGTPCIWTRPNRCGPVKAGLAVVGAVGAADANVRGMRANGRNAVFAGHPGEHFSSKHGCFVRRFFQAALSAAMSCGMSSSSACNDDGTAFEKPGIHRVDGCVNRAGVTAGNVPGIGGCRMHKDDGHRGGFNTVFRDEFRTPEGHFDILYDASILAESAFGGPGRMPEGG